MQETFYKTVIDTDSYAFTYNILLCQRGEDCGNLIVMIKISKALTKLSCVCALVVIVASCSSPEKKAMEYMAQLNKNDKVLNMNLIGENKEIISSIQVNDSTLAAVIYSLESEKIATLASMSNAFAFCEAIPVNTGYMVITRENRLDNNYHYIYQAYIIRNHTDPKARSIQKLLIDKNNNNLAGSGYVIDKESKTLTLASYDKDDNEITIYHTVYDFDGNQILEDPIEFDLRPIMPTPAYNEATYIWECQYCGEKRNSAKDPGPWEFTCHGRGEAKDFGNSHKWVKIGRVD